MRLTVLSALLAASLPARVLSFASTDSVQDADPPQSGYLPNHNIDPTTLGTWKGAWTQTFNTGEYFYAKPLVYTPQGYANEIVILVSNQNIVRVLNGVTGAVLTQRTLDAPFASSDSNCGDIPNTVGITGTPIIDPSTDIMYFFSKGYKNGQGGAQGTINGQYKMYAVQLPGLQDVNGYPISMEGQSAWNDRTRYFIGGTLLQRPSLAMMGDSIIAGFGGHCDNFNYTGYLVTASKSSAAITNMQAMVAAPGAATPQTLDIMVQGGGKSAIWQSGFGIPVDPTNNRFYVVTGNARGAGVNGANKAVSGKIPISTLEQCAINWGLDPKSGALKQQDYFEPFNYDNNNGADKDFGSSGLSLLDPTVFSGGGVNRIAVAPSKEGKVYIMDADNLGGFDPNGDHVLQTITMSNSFYGGIASYPLEGGYIYFCTTSGSLQAYKFTLNGGVPTFVFAGQSSAVFAGNNIPAVTSNNGQAGTGVVWLTDVNQGLVAYNAIPVNGVLTPITLGTATGRLSKFQRPAFGNKRVYTSQLNKIWCLAPGGAPPASAPAQTTIITPTYGSTSTSSTTSKPAVTTTSSTSTSTTTSKSSTTTSSSTSTTSQTTSSTTTTSSSTSTSNTSTTISSSSSISSTSSSTTTSKASTSSSVSTTSTSTSKTSTYSAAPTATQILPAGILRTYNWNITWVNASPDGFQRPFVGINGVWPCPPISANLGDTIKINVVNGLGNESTAIHFHGLFQKNTTFMDGPAMVTQCPITPGQTFVYEFRLLQSGTYWYHAHIGGQYIDGLRGPVLIADPNNAPYKYDVQQTLTLSDLYHTEAPYLVNYFMSPDNFMASGGAEPVPISGLINEAQNVKFNVLPGKTYLFNIVNMGAMAAFYLQMDQHIMTVVEVDGVFVQPVDVAQLFVGVAQRYSVLVKTKATATQNFAIVASMNSDMFSEEVTPDNQNPLVYGWLVYNAANTNPAPFTLSPQPWDDSAFIPYDRMALLDPPDQVIYLTASFGPDDSNTNRAYWNGVTYISPKVPTMYSALTAPLANVNDPTIYGQHTNPFVLPFNAIIELDINNHDERAHPFHLHGHNFQVISRSDGGANFPGLYNTPAVPMRRDTLVVYQDGSATIRFRADNPGINLFHCHTEWHVEAGLTATFIEAPDVLQSYKLYLPNSAKTVCDVAKIPRTGNAGGNTKNWSDVSGANNSPPQNYYGALITPPAKNPYTGP